SVGFEGAARYPEDWLFFAAGRIENPPEPFVLTPERPGLSYPDLVRAADAVVTKPGYGIFAECVANRTAMAHTDRGPFAEQRVMVARMHEYLPHAFIPPEDFVRGEWKGPLARLLEAPWPRPERAADGGEAAAVVLADYL
ncbi:MAG: hypothetical protein K8I02_01420, partial [Candidatus Methylomirabilis sp.]|nr:hypothetical protein [Deltaproteobacteria bacterium]